MTTDKLVEGLKQHMGYRDTLVTRCGACRFFLAANRGGLLENVLGHCELNPAIQLPVSQSGSCRHHKEKK